MILLVFDDPVTLAELEIGLSQYDSDITVLAYTGSTAGITPGTTIAGQIAATLNSVNRLVSDRQLCRRRRRREQGDQCGECELELVDRKRI